MGGGILPVAIHNGQMFFLAGQECEDQKWCDFGGGEKGTETDMQTAVREGCEELSGFFGSTTEIQQLLKNNLLLKILLESGKHHYTSFLVQVPYDPNLPFYFNNQYKFIKKYRPHLVCQNGLFEKKQMQWMTLADLNAKRPYFRARYRPIIDDITANAQQIMANRKF
jgi:hypothetical protein